ncbi:class I tRNA ligase family protein [Streptomyces sp. O3]
MTQRTVVISPAPTANGDLHLGHLAGPFLAADVHTRYARSAGREVLFGTGVQDTQTYVVTTAHRLGITAREMVARSAGDVAKSLSALGIGIDGYTGDERRFTSWVAEFMSGLHARGKLARRTVTLPYSPRTGEFLVDGHVRGGCPHCLADGCAGLCESCGHPIAAGELIDPRSTLHPEDVLERREADVLVLPTEEYRERLRAYFDRRAPLLRPHMAQAVQDLLARPLPDFQITYPISWGIPAPFPETPGQVINANAETMAWSIYTTAVSAEARGAELAALDELWSPEAESEVVYFLGFDNTFPFAVAGLAMLLAYEGRYRLPDQFVTNEFYELDNQKFSTSRGHVVGVRELTAELPRDLIRFHLAATSPEFQRTDFSRGALERVTDTRLVQPWNRITRKAERWAGRGELPVSERSRAAAARIVQRFAAAYELRSFSLNRAAEALADQLARLAEWEVAEADAGDFCHQVDVVLRCAAPILIDLAEQALPDASIRAVAEQTGITPRRLPRLSGGAV